MKVQIIDKLARIITNKVKLEKTLNVKITNRGKEVTFKGEAEDEYFAEKVLDALDFGFPYAAAISIKKEENLFEILNIKDYTKRSDLERVRARIIGKEGGTIKTLADLSGCFLELKDNQIGIIGPPENIQNAQTAIISIIRGSKQANMYSYLEKHKPQKVYDIDLKEKKKL